MRLGINKVHVVLPFCHSVMSYQPYLEVIFVFYFESDGLYLADSQPQLKTNA